MFSMVAKGVPLRPTFRVGNSQKSLGARSGKYSGWVMIGMLFSARNCCTTSDVWLGALATVENIECDDRTPEDSKKSLLPVLPTMAGSIEQVCVCVCAQGSYFESD